MKPSGLENIEDFVTNDLFVDWVLEPNEENITFWATYLADFPDKLSIVEAAKTMVLQLYHTEEITAYEGNIETNWSVIQQKTVPLPSITRSKIKHLSIWRYVATMASLFLIGILSYQFLNTHQAIEKNDYSDIQLTWHELKNTTAIATTIYLSDGSKVILEPFSTLKYPNLFLKNQREVILKGEAFFDIKKDTTKPFVVYANETITKVLGTSFTIKAFEGEEEVQVEVKTGKVAVYAQVNSLPKKVIGESEKFIIRTNEQMFIPIPNKKLEVTPNQTVIFDKVKADMQKVVSALPLPVKPIEQLQQFQFKEEPLPIVLKALEKAYGLDINYTENLTNCLITTSLEEVSIFNKLDIICQAMDLEYEEREATIFISGIGCN